MRNLKFRSCYQRMPRAKRIAFRNLIIKEAEISIGTFYNWYHCITRIPDHLKPRIAEIMQIDIVVLFPENETISI